jgi:hypothetical protein
VDTGKSLADDSYFVNGEVSLDLARARRGEPLRGQAPSRGAVDEQQSDGFVRRRSVVYEGASSDTDASVEIGLRTAKSRKNGDDTHS